MDTFHWISVAVSMILGLGVARLLTGIVAVFHARHRSPVDWLPLVWVASIFIQQIDFWWSLQELSILVPRWTLGGFLLLVGLVLSLFLAAALVIPPASTAADENLQAFFDHDGRWALLAVAGFNAFALLADWVFWGVTGVSPNGVGNLALILLPIIGFAGSRRVRMIMTWAYLLALLGTVDLFSPTSY